VPKIIVEGLDELERRFSKWPVKFRQALRTTVGASLLIFWENVPGYPQQSPETDYRRTGTLGRTLGSSMTGGKAGGKPDIYGIQESSGYMAGEFGTRLNYAPYVIGETQQARMHRGRWWTIRTIAERSVSKITRAFVVMTEELAAWLDHGK